MQSKGKLGSILAGLIAVFLVLVCAFYLSFTFVGNSYEDEAQGVARAAAAKAPAHQQDSAFNVAYRDYMDAKGEEPVYMGWTLNEVKKWGVNLGLDLKGGMNVILQVDMPDMMRQMSTVKGDSLFEKALAVAQQKTRTENNGEFVPMFIAEYKKLNPGADMSVIFPAVKPGASDQAVTDAIRDEVQSMVNTSATQTLRKRIDGMGVVSPNIQVLEGKDGQIMIELPGVKDHDRVRKLLQRSANLEFYTTYKLGEIQNNLAQLATLQDTTLQRGLKALTRMMAGSPVNPGYVIVGYTPNLSDTQLISQTLESEQVRNLLPDDLIFRWGVKPEERTDDKGKTTKLGYALYALKTTDGGAALDGEVVTDARADQSSNGFGGQEVSMTMNSDGARAWANITGANVGNAVAIVLDDQVYSAPNVNGAIEGGRSSITGDFTVEEAQDLANVLKAGKMKAKVNIVSDMVIGPSLGQQAIDAGMMSFVVALILLMIFMISIYGLIPGLIANLCLIFNLFFTLGIMASFHSVLTLSGICGIVLSLGMAVDANVLIFERAREELRAGKTPRNAIADGYANAFSAIFDSNLTSIITGIILLYFGTGPIKGFATTLIIGIVCSFFTAVYLSRLFFLWISKTKAMNNMTFTTALSRKMLTNTHINFLGQRKAGFAIVILLIAGFTVSLFTKSLNQGIDFSGGRNYQVKLVKDVKPEQIAQELKTVFPQSTVSVINIESSNQVRVSTNYKIDQTGSEVDDEIVAKLYRTLKPYVGEMTLADFTTQNQSQGIVSSQKVGPTIAADMKTDAYIAVSLALIAMFLYILVRFRNVAFSVGALAAVGFTTYAIIGFYSIFWGMFPFAMEIDQSFIAAVLTIIGYQINDTVVVFDRVRENVSLYPKQNFGELVNKSINATLGRTIMTSASTLLVLLCIFILGGDAVRSFVFAMIFGVIVGTCATIWIANPVAALVHRARAKKAAAKAA